MKFVFFFLTSLCLTVSRSILVCKCHNVIYGITECSNFILLHVAFQFFQGHLLKRLFFGFFSPIIYSYLLCPGDCKDLDVTPWACMHELISGLSILFHWFMCLFLCHYHTVLINVGWQYSLKSGALLPPALFLFLMISLTVWGLCGCIWILRLFALVQWKNVLCILIYTLICVLVNLIEIALNL